MQIFAARLAVVGLVMAAFHAGTEARGGHGVHPPVHDGRGVPNRKNFGYYGPKWRQWPGDQPAGAELGFEQPRGEAAPQLPAVDIPTPVDEVRKANPLQAGPQETEEPPADTLPSTLLPTTPTPREGAEPPIPEPAPQPAPSPRRQPGVRNGAGNLRLPNSPSGEFDSAAALTPVISPPIVQIPVNNEPLADEFVATPELVEADDTVESIVEEPVTAPVSEVDVEQVFAGPPHKLQPVEPVAVELPLPAALGPGQDDAPMAIAATRPANAGDAVQSRYQAQRTSMAAVAHSDTGVVTAQAVSDVGIGLSASIAPTANAPSSAKPVQVQYARPMAQRTPVRTAPAVKRRATANPLRTAEPSESKQLVEAEPTLVAPTSNPMRSPAPAVETNPLRK